MVREKEKEILKNVIRLLTLTSENCNALFIALRNHSRFRCSNYRNENQMSPDWRLRAAKGSLIVLRTESRIWYSEYRNETQVLFIASSELQESNAIRLWSELQKSMKDFWIVLRTESRIWYFEYRNETQVLFIASSELQESNAIRLWSELQKSMKDF